MKYISCFLLLMMIYVTGIAMPGQPAQQSQKSKAGPGDSKTAKNPAPKVQPAAPAQEPRQKPKKEAPQDDDAPLVPLSWRPWLAY